MSLMVSWSILQRKAVVSAEEASHIKGGVFQGRNLQNWALMLFFLGGKKSTAMLLSETHIHAFGLTLASFQGCVREKQPGINYLTIPREKPETQLSVIHTFSIISRIIRR